MALAELPKIFILGGSIAVVCQLNFLLLACFPAHEER
jgi:hypothetical protein